MMLRTLSPIVDAEAPLTSVQPADEAIVVRPAADWRAAFTLATGSHGVY
jgi:hypothetical protein